LTASDSLETITVIAPARVCLFGDHQDYLGLPIIACAINKMMVLSATRNDLEVFDISMPDIHSERKISIYENFYLLEKQDYFASALRVVKRYGCFPHSGYTITIKSEIPINAGISSSSALVVVWIHFLLKAFGCKHEITSQLIARLAYEAEVVEHQSPGGRMDQYTIAIGNILYIDTSQDAAYNTIGTTLNGLILAESGIPKETLGLLSHVKTNATKSIEMITLKYPDFDLKTAILADYVHYENELPKALKPFFYASIKNHIITQEALKVFKKNTLNLDIIGTLMTEHHQVLKASLKITVPKIDTMINVAIASGAYGAKIVGSGGGGSIVVLAPDNKKEHIIAALLECGSKSAYTISVTEGSKSK
jgi:galactokinase